MTDCTQFGRFTAMASLLTALIIYLWHKQIRHAQHVSYTIPAHSFA
jgi:hypothetical protein